MPKLIDALRAKGYEFVTVSELAGLARDQAMPPVPPRSLGRLVGLPVFMTLSWLGYLVTNLFFLAIWLGVARVVFLCGIGLRNRYVEAHRVAPPLPEPPPLQTVLMPAFNEAKVIVQSVRHILASDYPESGDHRHRRWLLRRHLGPGAATFCRRSARHAAHCPQWR